MNCVNCTFPLPPPPATHCEHCGAPVAASLPPAPAPYAPPAGSGTPSAHVAFAGYGSVPTTMAPAAPTPSAPLPSVAPSARPSAFMAVLLAFALICSGIAGASLYALSQHSWPFSSPSAAPRSAPVSAPTSTPSIPTSYHFHDSLQSDANGWLNMPPSCYFGDGGYYVNNGSACPSPAANIGNGTVSVDVSLVQAAHDDAVAGIMFRLSADQNTYDKTYEIVIGRDGQWDVTKTVDGTTNNLVTLTTSSAIHKGLDVKNTLSVQMSGSHFVFFVDGAQIGTVDDPSLVQGGFALVALPGAEAIFSNFDARSAGN